MRGKVDAKRFSVLHDGITPACAGKRPLLLSSRTVLWDHPRVCGEKCLALLYACALVGSPPRVRGKDTGGLRPQKGIRITPACAGKRRSGRQRDARDRDHPRVCGEKADQRHALFELLGSPPRVRGKGDQGGRQKLGDRITPACAGKRSKQHIVYLHD